MWKISYRKEKDCACFIRERTLMNLYNSHSYYIFLVDLRGYEKKTGSRLIKFALNKVRQILNFLLDLEITYSVFNY